MKAYSYIRFSSAKQAGGDSYRRQVELAQTYCEQNGLELADSNEYLFFDAGRSAYKGQHLDDTGELARFLSYVEDGSIPSGSTLLVESLDRLSRDHVHAALRQFLDLLAKGITVVTLNDKREYRPGDDSGSLMLSIAYMARAHEESATKGKRVSAAWRNKQTQARAGKPIGKLCPHWLVLEGDVYNIISERADVVRQVFELSTTGYGSRAIAATLNQQGILTFTAQRVNSTGLWAASTIRHMLESRAVLGEYQPHQFVDGKRVPQGDPITNYFPAVVSEETWWLAQAARSSRNGGEGVAPVTKTSKDFNVWAGVLFCRCGGAMHIMGQHGKRYYRCTNQTKGTCASGRVGNGRAEAIFKEILSKVDSLSLVQGNANSLTKQLSILDGRLVELKAKYSITNELHEEFPSRASARRLAEMEAEMEQLENEQNKLIATRAADVVVSKEDFFRKLDLVSYGGRSAANNLLKRLHIKVMVEKRGRSDERYQIVDATGRLHVTLFYVEHVGADVAVDTTNAQFADVMVMQGEMNEEDAERLQYAPEEF